MFKKILSGQIIAQGEFMPPWYYGLTYLSTNRDECYFHIIPLNFILRAARSVRYRWDWVRSEPGRVDKLINKAVTEAVAKEHDYYYQQSVRVEKLYESKCEVCPYKSIVMEIVRAQQHIDYAWNIDHEI